MKIIESILEISEGKASLYTITTLWDRPELVAALKHALDTGAIKHLTGKQGGQHFCLPDYDDGDDSSEAPNRDEEKEHGKIQELLDIMATSEEPMSISTLSKKAGMSREKTKTMVDSLCLAGKVYRSGERYGLTKEVKAK